MAKSPKNNTTDLSGYMLSRSWFDFAFENQGIVSGNHGCMFLWFIELNNRMGWAKQFGAPRDQTMAAVGITSHNTYKKVFEDLVKWGFVKLIKESKNQYTANIIALSKNDIAFDSSLDKALTVPTQNLTEHCSSTMHGTVSGTVDINKQVNLEPLNIETIINKEGATEIIDDSPVIETPPPIPVFVITVKNEKIFDLKKFLDDNFPSICNAVEMKMGREKYKKRLDEFEWRINEKAYLDEAIFRDHYSNFMYKTTPDEQSNPKPKNTSNPRTDRAARNEGVAELAEKSTEFLRAIAGENS